MIGTSQTRGTQSCSKRLSSVEWPIVSKADISCSLINLEDSLQTEIWFVSEDELCENVTDNSKKGGPGCVTSMVGQWADKNVYVRWLEFR